MIRPTLLPAVALAAMLGLGPIAAQAERPADYAALGSSFAAGIGLGPVVPGAPPVCMRTTQGYPGLLARKLRLRLVDASCAGSTTVHILSGGQGAIGPQIDAVTPRDRLVTITSGGNDVGYIGDLLAGARALPVAPRPIEQRDFGAVTEHLEQIVTEARRRAPKARIVLVSYPAVIPPTGTCATLGITPELAALARQIAARLHAATRAAATHTGALFVDVAMLSTGHDACAADPWTNGATPIAGAPFHPNGAGAAATAAAVAKALRQ